MITEILMPKLGMAMTEGHLSEWRVNDGAQVNAGEVIYCLESDKAVTEVEAPVSGTIRLRAEPDQTYAVGTLVAEIE
jgi:pyruvate/2-oxoglutarate dehydrogenase complex dihydrolipoamide acyltransferase (E2) component